MPGTEAAEVVGRMIVVWPMEMRHDRGSTATISAAATAWAFIDAMIGEKPTGTALLSVRWSRCSGVRGEQSLSRAGLGA